MLVPGRDRAAYLAAAISKSKRHTLGRQRRRLADNATVAVRTTTDPASIAHALGDFLALEAGGWKGRAGSASAANPKLNHFMRNAVIGARRREQGPHRPAVR